MFDGIDIQNKIKTPSKQSLITTEILVAAKKRISKPKLWNQYHMWKLNFSWKSLPHYSYCALGSLIEELDKYQKSNKAMIINVNPDYFLYLAAIDMGFVSIANFNDSPYATHSKIMELYDRAILLSREDSY